MQVTLIFFKESSLPCTFSHMLPFSSPLRTNHVTKGNDIFRGGNVLLRDVVRFSARETISLVQLRPMHIGCGA